MRPCWNLTGGFEQIAAKVAFLKQPFELSWQDAFNPCRHPPSIGPTVIPILRALSTRFTLSVLLQACDATLPGLRDAALMSLAYDTGLRVSELVRVAAEHIASQDDGSAVLTIP